MSKIFIRTYQKNLSATAWWETFEKMLRECLIELGHEVIEQAMDNSTLDQSQGAKYKIYAHKNKRDIPGDLFYKQMHLLPLFTIDPLGWGAENSAMQQPPSFEQISPETAANFCQTLSHNCLETGLSKHIQPAKNQQIVLPKDYIFVPIQRPNDYVINHYSPICVKDFIILLAQWANLNKQNIVFKLHPYNFLADHEVVKVAEKCASESDYISLLDGNIHKLVTQSKGVFVINSGVGFESLIHGKPVVTFGNCDYKWVTFRASPDNLDEAQRYVGEFSDTEQEKQWQYVYYYHFYHAYSIESIYYSTSQERLLKFLANQLY